jgi:hypothetical protein
MKDGKTESPWIQMFQNAREWCEGVKFWAKKIRKKNESRK